MNEIRIPRENANDDSVLILKIHFNEGDKIKKGDVIFEYETSKAVVEHTSEFEGMITKINGAEGEEVTIDSVLIELNGNIEAVSNDIIDKKEIGNISTGSEDDILIEELKNNENLDKKSSNDKEVRYKLGLPDADYEPSLAANDNNDKYIRKLLCLEESKKSDTKNNIQLLDSSRHEHSKNQESDKLYASNEYKKIKQNNIATSWITTHDQGHTDLIKKNSIKKEIEDQSNKNYKKLPPRKRAEILALQNSADGKFQSCLSIKINGGNRKNKNFIYANLILDIVVYETKNLLNGEFKSLNRKFFEENYVEINEEVVPGVAFDDGGALTVCSINNSKNMNLHDIQNYISGLMERYETKKFLEGELDPSTFTVSDLSNTDIDSMFPLISDGQAFIIGITKTNDSYNIFGTFDHRVTEGYYFSKFLGELARRVDLYFDKSTSYSLSKCFVCGIDAKKASSYNRHGLMVVDTEDGIKKICRGCFDG